MSNSCGGEKIPNENPFITMGFNGQESRGGFWIVGNISGHPKPRFQIQYMIQNKNQVPWTPWFLALTFASLEGVALECIFRQ
jgi:hypothetical protein